MAAARFASPGKNVLQQTNNNVPVIMEPREEYKPLEKDGATLRRKRRNSQETENRMESSNSNKSVASKLRKVRLGTSSHKLSDGMQQVILCRGSSEESGGEEDKEQEDGIRTRKAIPRPIIPNYVTKSDEVQLKKKKKTEANALDLSSQIVREAKPQAPMSIAKRNARERNRVKLVNQGFALLRSRIPDYISEIYTEERKKKKVSKVETLRMALGYIRHLTEMLDLRSADPGEWLRIKTNDPSSWSDASGSKTGYPSPVSVECPSPATTGIYGSEEQDFYDYQLEMDTVKDLSVKGAMEERESLLLEESDYSTKEDELVIVDDRAFEIKDEGETLSLSSDAFPIDVGCCYDLVKVEPDLDDESPDRKSETEKEKKKLVLPSITESFPKKNLRVFYQTPAFLTGSTAFHV